MNGYERAVIDAAKAWRASAYTSNNPRQTGALIAATDALVDAERNGPIEQLAEWIRATYPADGNNGKGPRALSLLMRNVERSGSGHRWDSSQWSTKITTMRQFADMDADTVRDTRNAGPATWAIWAEGLRSFGIEPAWAEKLVV